MECPASGLLPSRAGFEKPQPRPGIGLEELEQLLGYLAATGFAKRWFTVDSPVTPASK